MPDRLDLKYKPTYGVQGIAQLLAQKPMMEEQIKASQRQGKHQKFNRFLNTISAASQIAQMANRSRQQKLARQQQELTGELLAGAVDTGLEPGAAGPISADVYNQQQVAAGIPSMSGPSAQIAKAFSFPGMEDKKSGASPIGSLMNYYGTLTNESMILDPDSEEYRANVKQRNSVSKRIASLGGNEYVPIPLPPKKQVVVKKEKGPGFFEKVFGGIGNAVSPSGVDAAVGPGPKPMPKKYRTAKDVQQAYRNGEISKKESLRLLREKFGYE